MTDVVQGSRELQGIEFDDGDVSELGARSSLRGPIITISIVLALVVATGLTVLGLGVTDTDITNVDASSWLASSTRGEVDHVNGVTAKVDTRAHIKDAQNHQIQVTQTDKYLILRDVETGQVSTLDLKTLQAGPVTPTTPGRGVTVALFDENAFIIDSVQGQVSQLDPSTLAPIGDTITLPNGLAPAGFDGKGTLWIAIPTEGTVVAISPGKAGPKVVRTVAVAPPGHDLSASALDDGVAVLDNTDQVLDTVHGDKVTSAPVPVNAPATIPPRTTGPAVPVTVASERQVVVVEGSKVVSITVPGDGVLSPAVAFAGHIYCADSAAGIVYEFDGDGKLVNQIKIDAHGGPLELEVREDHLFINAPDGTTAAVVDENHVVKPVEKYPPGVLGGDPPPPPPKPKAPPKPVKTVPGQPQNLVASAGNATVHLSWRAAKENGAAITKYVVSGGGSTFAVGANQRTAVVRGLANGKTYVFSVHAVNAIGAGPDAKSPPVMPTADVPSAPTAVTATANPDGSVSVTWPPANGLGRKIIRYTVSAVTGGAQAPIGDVQTPKITIPDGTLDYGTQVAFTVIAVNDKGAGSDPSPASNTVVPYNKPGAPGSLAVSTDAGQKGAVVASWQPAPSNGRQVDKYVVDANGKTQDVTGTTVTLTGFGDDEAVTVKVHAVNAAGDGPIATDSGRTIGVPTLTLTSSSADFNSVSVTFTPNNKGGAATCKVQVTGAGTAQAACTTQPVTLTVTGLWPNGTYSFTATVTTPAGSASATGSRATSQLHATVLCGDTSYCGTGIYIYSVPTQANPANSVGRYVAGDQFTPICHVADDDVDARPWGGRDSTQWLKLTYKGKTAYFPFAWANTDGGNNLGLLPAC